MEGSPKTYIDAVLKIKSLTISLQDAVLCCNCELVSAAAKDDRCIACGRATTLRLSLLVGVMAKAVTEYVAETEKV